MFDAVKNDKLELELVHNILDGQQILVESFVTVESKSLVGASVSFNIYDTNKKRILKITNTDRLFLFDLDGNLIKELLLNE